MLTKNAIGNMMNRYNAVLSKCRLLNVFGTLALAGVLAIGGVGGTIEMGEMGGLSGVSSAYAATTVDDFILGYTTDGGYTFTETESGTYSFNVGTKTYYVTAPATASTTTTTIIGKEDSALENDEANASIIADFIANKNFADSITSTDNGGAINNTATNVTISGDFIGNWASFHGGAVYNTSSITSITGNFIGNSTVLQGGAICNSGSIGNISGDFIGNISGGSGAAIFNDSGTIDTISGDFAGNKAGGSGGAIQNSFGTITTISGTFSGNTSADVGGAICNFTNTSQRSTIGDSEDSSTGIIANFANNTAEKGGAIYNSEKGLITSISGNFAGNNAIDKYGQGGAIYNDGTISSISGNFTENSAIRNYSKGGAIYNNEGDTISSISGNFTGNKAGSQGGAIFTDGNLTFLSAGSAYSFTNNVAGADYNAINSFKKDITLTFKLGDANNANGSFTMNDSISGMGYTVAIIGEGTGERTFNLNDEIDDNGAVIVTGATLTLGTFKHTGATDVHGTALDESTTVGSVLGSLTVGTTDDHAKLLVNLEDTNQTATINKLTVTKGSSLELAAGTLNLTNISAPFNGTMTANAGTTLKLGNAVTFDHADALSDISAATVVTDNVLTIKNGTLVVDYDAVVGTNGALHDKVTLNGESTSAATLTLCKTGTESFTSAALNEELGNALLGATRNTDTHFVNFTSDKGTIKITGLDHLENYLHSFIADRKVGDVYYVTDDDNADNGNNAVCGGVITAGTSADNTLTEKLTATSLFVGECGDAEFTISTGAVLTLVGGDDVVMLNKGTLTNKGMLTLQDGAFNGNLSGTGATSIEGAVAITGGTFDLSTANAITVSDTDAGITINNGKVIAKYDDVMSTGATLQGNITLDGTSADAAVLELQGTKSLTSTEYNAELGKIVTEFASSGFSRDDVHVKTLTSEKGSILTDFILTDNYLADFIADSGDAINGYIYAGDIDYNTTDSSKNILDTKLTANSLNADGNASAVFTIASDADLILKGSEFLLDAGELVNNGSLTLGTGSFNGNLSGTGTSNFDGLLTITGGTFDLSTANAVTANGSDAAIAVSGGELKAKYDDVIKNDAPNSGALDDKVTLGNGTLTLNGSGELNSKDYSAKLDAVATAFTDDGITRNAHMTDFNGESGTVNVTGYTLGENYLASFLTKVRIDIEGVYIYAVETIDYDSSADSDQNTLLAGTRLIANSLNSAGKSGASFEIAENAFLVLGGETLATADTVTNKGMLALQNGVFNAVLSAIDTATTAIEGKVSLNQGATISGTVDILADSTLEFAHGTSNLVGATFADLADTATISIADGATVTAGFDDFVTNAGAPADANATYGDTTLSMSGLEKHVSLVDGASLILDGEAAYVNKEDFAEFLKATGTGSWGEFVASASCVIDYGVSQDSDYGSATIDNSYTFDTGNGTITVTNVNLTKYYSLNRFLATADPAEGSYTIPEAVISGTLAKDVTLTGATLLKGVDDTIIEDGATLTLTGAGYVENGTEMNKGVLATTGANVINSGTLNLGESGNTNTLTFGGDLTTGETGTTTAASAIEIAGAVTASGMVTFKGETTLKDTLTINGGKTIFKKTATVEGITNITDGALGFGSNASDVVTLAGVNVGEKGVFDIDNGKVVLTGDSTFAGMLFMGQGTGIEADGAHVTIHEGPNTPDAYLFAKGSDSVITVERLGNGGAANFNAYADEGGKLIFGALPKGEGKTQFDYIASQMGSFDAKDMLYVGLGTTLNMASGASLVVDGAPLSVTNTPTSVPTSMLKANAVPASKPNVTPNAIGANFGANSLFIANLAGLGADQAVIDGGGNALTVDANSALGLVNAGEGEYTILDNFGAVTNADTNNEGTIVPWNEESVTVGNCLLVVDSVTGSGTDADPYKVKVRQDVNEDLYDTDGGGALEDVMNSGEYGPNTTNPLAQYLYQAGEKGDETLDKAKANTASAGANARSGAAAMAATRAAASTMSMRNIAMHKSAHKLKAVGGTLLIKDANGNVKAEYDNVVQVADNGSTSDVPAALGSTDTGLANSISLWAMPFYGHESISGAHVGSHSNDTRTDMYGMTMGIDKTFTPSGIDVCRFGLAFNVGTGETEGSGYTGSSENTFDFFGLAAYGSMRKGAAMLSASVSYTNTDSEFNSEGIRGETDADVWYGALNGEYAFTMGTLENSKFFSNFNIIPYVGLGLMTNKVDDYATSLGSPVQTDRQSILTIPLGLKFNKECTLDSGWILKPEITAGVIFADGDLYQRTATGNTLGSNLDTIRSQVMDRTTMDLGFSLDMRKDEFGLFLDYSLQKSDMRTAHGVSAKLEYQF